MSDNTITPEWMKAHQPTTPEEKAEAAEKAAREIYDIAFNQDFSVMIVTIPLKKWALDDADGDIKAMGVFGKAERMALRNMQLLKDDRKRKVALAAAPDNFDPLKRGPGHA
jgi:predicted aminopeptidase